MTGKQLPLVYKSPPKTPSKYLATAFSIHDYEKREPSQVHVAAVVIWAGVWSRTRLCQVFAGCSPWPSGGR